MAENYVILKCNDGVRTITLNRPKMKNAMNSAVYQTITRVLNEDAKDDTIVVTILTGTGSYFSSGNDIKSAMSEDLPVEIKLNMVKEMVSAFINYPKLLIAVVNGPAVGIAATIVALCDIVYATDNAIFDTPFVRLGLCAEAASSFTYPQVLGRSKASEVLLLNHKLTAQEAYQFGLISKIIPHSLLDGFIESLLIHGKLPLKTLMINKQLIMANFKSILSKNNSREVEQLSECIESEDFVKAVTEFMNRKSKL